MTRWKEWLDGPQALSPIRAFLHPAFVLAVFLLILNDHFLKESAHAGLVTGKLSDFAGLFFAPVLLAALVGVRSRRGLVASGLAVGTVFAALNTSTAFAGAFDALASLFVSFHTTVDPTDLVALVAIPAGLWLLSPAMVARSSAYTRRIAEYAMLTVAALASMATSRQQPCDGIRACNDFVEQEAQVSILNKTDELHVLRLRFLRESVVVDCDEARKAPTSYLLDASFGAPQTWFVQSGQEIPVQPGVVNEWGEVVDRPTGDCHAALIESDTAPDILAFWDADLNTKFFAFDADIPRDIPADPQTIVLEADYEEVDEADRHPWRNRSSCGERADLCANDILAPLAEVPPGARYFWRSQHSTPLHFDRSAVQSGTIEQVDEACQMPGPEASLSWEAAPTGDLDVVGVEAGLDGCHQVLLLREWDSPEDSRPYGWWVCAPIETIEALAPQEDGRTTRVAIVESNRPGSLFHGGYNSLRIDVTENGPDGEFEAFRKIFLVRGYDFPDDADFDLRARPRAGCAPVEAQCGQVAVPADLFGPQFTDSVAPGESVSFGDVLPVELHVLRAEYRPVRDAQCPTEGQSGLFPSSSTDPLGYMESVILTR